MTQKPWVHQVETSEAARRGRRRRRRRRRRVAQNTWVLIIVVVAGTVYSQSNNLNLKNRLTINNSIDLPKDI